MQSFQNRDCRVLGDLVDLYRRVSAGADLELPTSTLSAE
jgi:hypothetical protein